MFRVVKLAVVGTASLAFVAVASVLLFWLGRNQTPVETVLGGEEDLYDDDPGEDVDE